VELQELATRIIPILGFVLCISVVAELADRIGVFAVLADRVTVLAGGSVWRLWALVAVLATLATAVLSLDTTAVLLTPVALALVADLGLDLALFAYTTVWLANTASLELPVSNLTNLLALHVLPGNAPRFAALMWPAAATSVLVTVAALAVIFRQSLRGRYVRALQTVDRDRPLLAIAMTICLVLGPVFAIGVDITYASAVAAVVGDRLPRTGPMLLSPRLVPWLLLVGVAMLFVIVQIAHDYGLGQLLGAAAGRTDNGLPALLRLTGVAALGANLVDNLPSYLAMEPVADSSPLRMAALLVGVNSGPLITPWASLATLLWAGRCRAAGVSISWRNFGLRGLFIVPALLVASTATLAAYH
jgi:arsenical pump membrane protein